MFLDDSGSEDDVNPDSEPELLFEGEVKEENQATKSKANSSTTTSKASGKKRSKRRALPIFPLGCLSFQFISLIAVDAVYSELTRKLCNTRIQEFPDSTRQLESAKAGKGILKLQRSKS